MNEKDRKNLNEKIYVTRSSLPNFDDYCNMIKQIWNSHWLTNNGELHERLQVEIEKYLGVDNVVLFTNGHLSLENVIKAMNLTGEVITTPFTFVSTTHAISRNGLTPVFCDINPNDYTIDVNKIESLITKKTSAIIPVHVYGNVCNVDEIEKIAKKHHLKVIYDAAHAFGVEYKGKGIANYGDASMFSFHATKVFNTIEGGCIAYNGSNELANILNKLKNFGIENEEEINYIGGNAKMNEFQAAMGLCNLKELNRNIAKRKKIYLEYLKYLKDISGIKINKIQNNVKSNYAYFPILITDDYELTRDELFNLLKKHNIYSRKYFYPITNETICYKKLGYETPIALDLSNRILTLPMYSDLELNKVRKICKIIKEKK